MKDFDRAQDFVDSVTNTDRDERHREQMLAQENRAQRRERDRQERRLSKRKPKAKSDAA